MFNRGKKKLVLFWIIMANHEKNGVFGTVLSASNLHEELNFWSVCFLDLSDKSVQNIFYCPDAVKSFGFLKFKEILTTLPIFFAIHKFPNIS